MVELLEPLAHCHPDSEVLLDSHEAVELDRRVRKAAAMTFIFVTDRLDIVVCFVVDICESSERGAEIIRWVFLEAKVSTEKVHR